MHPEEQVFHALVGSVLNAFEIGKDRSGTLFVQAHGVHAERIDSSHFVGHRAGSRIGVGDSEHQITHAHLGCVGENVEVAVAGILVCERVGLLPSAVHMVVEIFTNRGVLVKIFGIQTFQMLRLRRASGQCNCHGKCKFS